MRHPPQPDRAGGPADPGGRLLLRHRLHRDARDKRRGTGSHDGQLGALRPLHRAANDLQALGAGGQGRGCGRRGRRLRKGGGAGHYRQGRHRARRAGPTLRRRGRAALLRRAQDRALLGRISGHAELPGQRLPAVGHLLHLRVQGRLHRGLRHLSRARLHPAAAHPQAQRQAHTGHMDSGCSVHRGAVSDLRRVLGGLRARARRDALHNINLLLDPAHNLHRHGDPPHRQSAHDDRADGHGLLSQHHSGPDRRAPGVVLQPHLALPPHPRIPRLRGGHGLPADGQGAGLCSPYPCCHPSIARGRVCNHSGVPVHGGAALLLRAAGLLPDAAGHLHRGGGPVLLRARHHRRGCAQ
mmetsp:Transcript_11612/g.25863  ORF Transcript_11612/g.25863 Transcript_11612/m.25863 type:complete len:354 (-) Transcript_11612:670-1731(-)